jgi:hypothetical protein
MISEIKELTREARQIIQNARMSWKRGEITYQQYDEVRHNTLLDVGYRAEVLTEPMPNEEA